ncbi:PhzF family phenazine biosynthesis protein [Phytohalomonas tamaricis]|uniref:PhzF family phenazine biosynthesis protein n=1 Tax=Phytohalomonas tamaricis TaxID=2081032 RepID=UPI000D0B9828|nr:PhzF family phenazine biosynthesis protein [Phytohalomonas tamaricis]
MTSSDPSSTASSTLPYVLLDVFTDRAFSGNPLAVFLEAGHLETDQMQRIARELNLSETVFVGPPSEPNRFPVRIFTPGCELPFAGHPTVGTARLLVERGMASDAAKLVLEEGVGDVVVACHDNWARLTTACPLELTGSVLSCDEAAGLLSLPSYGITPTPVLASCGVPYQLIELTSLDMLARVAVDMALWKALFAGRDDGYLYCYVQLGGGNVRARMFAPEFGIAEDPATGSAAAPLAGYLSRAKKTAERATYTIEQGIEMGRPSLIQAEVEYDDSGTQLIHIAGQAVIVGGGYLLRDKW